MKQFTVNGARVTAWRAEQGWFYEFATEAEIEFREVNIGGETGFIRLGPQRGKGWRPTLREIREHVAVLAAQ